MRERSIQIEYLENGRLAVDFLEDEWIVVRTVYSDTESYMAQEDIEEWMRY